MDKLTKGTWLVNTTKHICNIKNDTQELSFYEATEQAGKAATLLSRLVADKQEIIGREAVKTFARLSHIGPDAVDTYLRLLKRQGKVDFITDSLERAQEVEIYCFSGTTALEVASDIYESLNPGKEEEASLKALHSTYELPRLEEELVGILASDFDEETVRNTLSLQKVFSLVKENGEHTEKVLYNEYSFAGDPQKTIKAMKNLSETERSMVLEVQSLVNDSQGFLSENIPEYIPREIVIMMEGIGLLDGITVSSEYGRAVFFTTPQIKGHGVGGFTLQEDVFHKAKVLLSCLRFGEKSSTYSRGNISTQSMMMNIVNKLVRGEWVGPCTAIGQDYQLLEKDGVIETRRSSRINNTYFMKLRQSEVGKLAKQMISLNKVILEAEENSSSILNAQPSQYIIPEVRKQQIMSNSTAPVKALQEKILNSIRTGGR
ncbi:hypothetical protein PAEAM_06490 [Paenibacillus sp. GM1FR]|uniref:hypothetical protein n=1 Tax=Paenibacillus sp. GM1FR TaxID=2059267 RepID=UPI000C280F6D|nr:hypothetical protein [Paenibacillus sp. GM1FR]PJN64563.1 hypothetical protein PAEAM_06490 [Paenibacillus sp. GM1FR]